MSFKKQSDKILGWERLRAEVEELWEEAKVAEHAKEQMSWPIFHTPG